MEPEEERPWRTLGGAEGRAARVAAVRGLALEGLDPAAISERTGVAEWIVRRDLEPAEEDR